MGERLQKGHCPVHQVTGGAAGRVDGILCKAVEFLGSILKRGDLREPVEHLVADLIQSAQVCTAQSLHDTVDDVPAQLRPVDPREGVDACPQDAQGEPRHFPGDLDQAVVQGDEEPVARLGELPDRIRIGKRLPEGRDHGLRGQHQLVAVVAQGIHDHGDERECSLRKLRGVLGKTGADGLHDQDGRRDERREILREDLHNGPDRSDPGFGQLRERRRIAQALGQIPEDLHGGPGKQRQVVDEGLCQHADDAPARCGKLRQRYRERLQEL